VVDENNNDDKKGVAFLEVLQRAQNSSAPDILQDINMIESLRNSKTGRLKRTDAIRIFADKLVGGELGNCYIPAKFFPDKFFALENGSGERVPCCINAGDVIESKSMAWLKVEIAAAIRAFKRADHGENWMELLTEFNFSQRELELLTNAVLQEMKSMRWEAVQPFRFKSEPGLSWQRLDFDPDSTPGETPIWESMISRISNKTQVHALEAWFGSIFDPFARPQQAVWWYGPGRDGKGTVISLLMDMFGRAAASGHGSSHKDQYFTSTLAGKRFYANPDCRDTSFVHSDLFLQITGGDRVAVRRMRQSAVTEKLNCMMLIASNKKPEINWDGALRRRLIYVEFDSMEKPQDIEGFAAKLHAERARLIHRWREAWKPHAAEGLIPVDNQGFETLANETTDDIYDALLNKLIFDPAESTPVAELWAYLSASVGAPVRKHEDKRLIKNVLARRFGCSECIKLIDGKTQRVISGVKIPITFM
jgi:hypothetical protein